MAIRASVAENESDRIEALSFRALVAVHPTLARISA